MKGRARRRRGGPGAAGRPRGPKRPPAAPRPAERVALVALLGGAAVAHARQPRFFERLVPAWVPGTPALWNVTSGVAEGLAALLLCFGRTRRLGARLAVGTLATVYVANVQAAVDGGTPGVPGWGGTRGAALARLPLQWPPLWWAWKLARPRRS